MDRYSSWQGATGRTRRVPPRVAQRRRPGAKTAIRDGSHRWFIAFGTLALALLLPLLLAAQGSRTRSATDSFSDSGTTHRRAPRSSDDSARPS